MLNILTFPLAMHSRQCLRQALAYELDGAEYNSYQIRQETEHRELPFPRIITCWTALLQNIGSGNEHKGRTLPMLGKLLHFFKDRSVLPRSLNSYNNIRLSPVSR